MNIRSFLIINFFVLLSSFMSVASDIFVSDEEIYGDDEEIIYLQELGKKNNQNLPLSVYDSGNEARTYQQLIDLKKKSCQVLGQYNFYVPERQFINAPPQNVVKPMNRVQDGELSENSHQNFYH